MNNVFFDLRGGKLRVLITENESVVYRAVFDRFAFSDRAAMQKALTRITAESKADLGAAHLIMPNEAVIFKNFTLQKIGFSDAEKIIRKKITKDTGMEYPVFHLTPSGGGDERQQTYIAEIIRTDILKNCVDAFASFNIKVKTAVTGFQAGIKAFWKNNPDPMRTYALIEIENDSVGITVSSGGNVIYHETTPLAAVDAEKDIHGGLSEERLAKRKLYGIIDIFYNYKMSFLEKTPGLGIDNVLIYGADSKLGGVSDAVKDTIGADISMLNPFGDKSDDFPLFVGLTGLAAGVADKTAVNFLSAGYVKKLRISPDKIIMILAVAYVAMMILLTLFTEFKYFSAKKRLAVVKKEAEQASIKLRDLSAYLKNIEYLSRIEENRFIFYPLFRHLANKLPDDVFLEDVIFKYEKEAGLVELTFISRNVSDVGRKRTLTGLAAAMDEFKAFKSDGAPVVSIVKEGESKSLKIKMVYRSRANEKN